MTVPYSDQRAAIFVDIQNVYHSAKNLHHARVNFKELLRTAVGNRPLVRAFAYVVKSDTALGEDSFFEALRQTGFELRLKDLQIYPDGTKKADWDIGMAIDAVRLAPSVDAVILVTGDGDFVPLVEYLRWGLGKQVEAVAFRRSASTKLKEAVDRFVDIETIPRILLKIRERREKKDD
ncbi:MAG: NYN domain-containing protein [Candidatus Brennerbacteria bacterium]|nr:NYN domain-containing protein [Candidatus Brennerbacteria bacterium]